MNLPKPISMKYTELISKIETGKIKIPQFQRDFVWDLAKSAQLLDSIIKGYPIGTFIIWKTTERLKMVGQLGELVLREPEPNEKVEYVLDGQQRITSLYVALQGETIGKIDYSKIYIDLEAADDDDIIVTDVSEMNETEYIPFQKLLKSEMYDFLKLFGEDQEKIKLIDKYRHHIADYDFSVIEVPDAPIDVATDIFTRINVGGKPLTVYEIMCAKIYDRASEFDLAEKFNQFRDELREVSYDTIPENLPLQLLSLIAKKSCKSSVILGLKKEEVIGNWDIATTAIKSAIDFVRASFGAHNSKLLPYDVLLIPIAYYIYKTKCVSPTGSHGRYISDMFWRHAIMQRYNNGTEAKLATDITIIDNMIENNEYKPAISVDLSEKYLRENGRFRISKGLSKAIICLFLLQRPLRLDCENTKILTDDKELVKGNGKNYHHFFPKAYMRKKGYEDEVVDNIVNIIIVDDYTNKYRIKAKAPSEYIHQFSQENHRIGVSLSSHLIGDVENFGIASDNYHQFFSKRAEWINQELAKFLCLENEVMADLEDDIEKTDISAKEAYAALWLKLDEALKKQHNPIKINLVSSSRIQTSNIIPSKLDLRFVASAQNQTLSCELLFRDDAIYNQILTQKKDFESLCDTKNLVWPDQTNKNKKIVLDFPKSVNIFDQSRYERYVEWLIKNGAVIKETIELFAEDMNIGKGIAPDTIDNPELVFCKARTIMASALYFGKRIGFEVQRGSTVKLSTKAYGAAQRKRDELIRNGKIKVIGDGKGEFMESCIFTTPSQAADVVLGGSNNGWVIWKNAADKTLDLMYRSVLRDR